MSIKRKPSKFELAMIISPIRYYIKRKYNIVVEKNDTLGLKGPYIILSNHVNNWDPLFINCFVEEPLCFVAAAPLFRNKVLKKVLHYTGAISKTKLKNDTGTIRNMLTAKKYNRSMALFPEGNRNWNGHTDDTIYATAKLIKLLGIPVVIATIKGGYLSNPRWADTVRQGKVTLSLEKKWDEQELKKLSVEDLHRLLNEVLSFDEIAWNEQQKIEFHGKGLANYLERYLFTCPHCKAIGTMHSEEDEFMCKSCAYKVRYNVYGSLDKIEGELYFKYLKDWNEWQLNFISEQSQHPSFNDALFSQMNDEVELSISENEAPYTKHGLATVTWGDNILHIKTNQSDYTLSVPFNQIEALNVHMHNKLDFFIGEKLVRLTFIHPRTSAYKWQKLVLHYTKKEENTHA